MSAMNITIDDTGPDFVWSEGDVWRAQAPNQVAINSNYFLQTYHAAQTKGASVSISFIGSSCQIYGSKGPNHGNYSVTFDNAVKFLPGFATTTQYRQLLFSHTFGTEFETHTVTLKNEEDFWLDIDFMVLSISTDSDTSTSDIGFFPTTVQPSTSVPPESSSSGGSNSSNLASSGNNSIFRTLTFVLAALLGILLLVGLVFFLLHRSRSRRRQTGANSEQGFRYGHKVVPSVTIDFSQGEGKDAHRKLHSSSLLGLGRGNPGKRGIEGASLMQTPTTATVADHSPFNRNSALATSTGGRVNGAGRKASIALNDMGKRPGHRSLAGDAVVGSVSANGVLNTSHKDAGRETPTSVMTLGSAGLAWLGSQRNDPELRFKGRARQESITGQSDSDTNQSSSPHPLGGRSAHYRGGSVQTQGKEDEYASGGIGLGIYSNSRAEMEQRKVDLRRNASVASSGIIDRSTLSPPPAVPDLPSLSSSTSSINGRSTVMPNRSLNPGQTDSLHSQAGAMRLQPPPTRGPQEERERERSLRERERAEKDREAARDREERERQRQRQRQRQEYYSRPPPEYMATPDVNEIPVVPTQGIRLQRQGTRTGDIPIGIEGGFAYDDSESQESHSVAHAFVQTALHVQAPPALPGQELHLPNTIQKARTYSYSGLPYAQASIQPPQTRPQHMRDNGSGSVSASGSLAIGATSTATKRAITPDSNRSYTPDRTMAVPRTSEDNKVWTLEGFGSPSLADRQRGVGMSILDDRTRLVAASPPIPSRGTTRAPLPPS